MPEDITPIIHKLAETHSLTLTEYESLIVNRSEESARLLRNLAVSERVKIYGYDVYVRGLIEVSNICRNDCYYCGIRRSNSHCERYRLTPEQILSCSDEGYDLGFRTFVLQGGEDSYFTDEVLGGIVRDERPYSAHLRLERLDELQILRDMLCGLSRTSDHEPATHRITQLPQILQTLHPVSVRHLQRVKPRVMFRVSGLVAE